MAVKIKDIAQALGLSPATVSLVLNNKPGVGNDTRERVIRYAKEVGYAVSTAHKPSSRATRSIRFIVYKKHGRIISDTPFFSELIESIELESRKENYGLVISYINETDDRAEVMRIVRDNPLDGIIILATEMDINDIQSFRFVKVPVVILDNYFEREKFDTVVINNTQGAYEATKYLAESGHVQIGHLQSSVTINNFYERNVGFMKALADEGLMYDPANTIMLSPSIDVAYTDMMQELQKVRKLPTAFFADNDIIAFGAIKAMKEFGLNLPQDVSVIGFDDMPYCRLMEPNLTTIGVNKKLIGALAVKRMMEHICSNENEFVKIEVGTELVVRDSVAVIK